MPGLLFPFRQESSCSYLGINLDFGWLTDLALRLLPFIYRLQFVYSQNTYFNFKIDSFIRSC